MINSIIESIIISLKTEFGDRYKTYSEKAGPYRALLFYPVFKPNGKAVFLEALFQAESILHPVFSGR